MVIALQARGTDWIVGSPGSGQGAPAERAGLKASVATFLVDFIGQEVTRREKLSQPRERLRRDSGNMLTKLLKGF